MYIFTHQNYLDLPRITPYPPITGAEHMVTGFADDWWFALLFIVDAILLLSGSILAIKKLKNGGLYMASGLYTAIGTAFFIRGVIDNRFNLTWIASLLVVLLILGVAKGGGHNL
jgi:hypothetical protein